MGTTVPKGNSDPFGYGTYSLKKVYVPAESLDDYSKAYSRFLPEGAEICAIVEGIVNNGFTYSIVPFLTDSRHLALSWPEIDGATHYRVNYKVGDADTFTEGQVITDASRDFSLFMDKAYEFKLEYSTDNGTTWLDGGAFISVPANIITDYPAYTNATIYTEAKSKASLGSSFDISVYLSGTYDGYSFEFFAPEGLNVLSVTPANVGVNIDEKNGYWLVSVIGGLDKVDSEKEEIVTVTVEVDRNAELGNRELSLSEVMISNNSGDEVDLVNCNYATIEIIKCIPGDVNGDDVFNYYDVSKLYAYFRGLVTVSGWAEVDVNGDEVFNYYDVSKIYAIYRGLADFSN